jgi:AhpC/TSA family protein
LAFEQGTTAHEPLSALVKFRQARLLPWTMRICLLRITTLFCFVVSACVSIHASEPYGLDLQGAPVKELAGPGIRVVVLIFAASDCPISNRYVPEIARLDHEFTKQGVRIWWVFPNPEDNTSTVAQHNHSFAIAEPTVLDTRQYLVQLAHVTTTPEAAVFRSNGNVLREAYRGRIDDRYLSIGQERPQPQHRELEAAIAAALADKPVPPSGGPPIGCSIVSLQK